MRRYRSGSPHRWEVPARLIATDAPTRALFDPDATRPVMYWKVPAPLSDEDLVERHARQRRPLVLAFVFSVAIIALAISILAVAL